MRPGWLANSSGNSNVLVRDTPLMMMNDGDDDDDDDDENDDDDNR